MRSRGYATAALVALLTALPYGTAHAAATILDDRAHVLPPAVAAAAAARIATVRARTGKEIAVVTVPSLDGTDLSHAVERAFAAHRVDGVLIFLAAREHRDVIVGDRESRAVFPLGFFQNVHRIVAPRFRAGDDAGGVATAVDLIATRYLHPVRDEAAAAIVPGSEGPALADEAAARHRLTYPWYGFFLVCAVVLVKTLRRAFFVGPHVPKGWRPTT